MGVLVLENLYLGANKDLRDERLQKIREIGDGTLPSVQKKDCVREVLKGAVTKPDNCTAIEKMTESNGSKLDKLLHNWMRQIPCLLRFIRGSTVFHKCRGSYQVLLCS